MSSDPAAHAVVLNEKTAFSWPVAVVVGAMLLGAGGGVVKMNRVQTDVDILRSELELLKHQQSADRGQLSAQGATLTEVKSILVELRTDVREALRGRK